MGNRLNGSYLSNTDMSIEDKQNKYNEAIEDCKICNKVYIKQSGKIDKKELTRIKKLDFFYSQKSDHEIERMFFNVPSGTFLLTDDATNENLFIAQKDLENGSLNIAKLEFKGKALYIDGKDYFSLENYLKTFEDFYKYPLIYNKNE
ncbi:MGF_100-3L [African swine fever virus]|uniref:MGF 100-3L CDS protein n=1 Tax=African swine fever virus TaxID=10497 RepID=A0A6V6ZEH0_ASF|nr:MGF 100-3L [African swine fever virus]WEG42032.1 MGF 100-3L [African swine fever virus]WEG42492.1 MGF 100-3L [African swine fever virus]WEG42671.1 MGF 100-3L [African swine fever virus]WFV29869.1 MGF 100-3L [African swine fever virus]